MVNHQSYIVVSSNGDRQRAGAFYQNDRRKKGQQAMNRDKGSYQLSHAYIPPLF